MCGYEKYLSLLIPSAKKQSFLATANGARVRQCKKSWIYCSAAWLFCTIVSLIPAGAHDLPLDRIMNGLADSKFSQWPTG
jgi:hypothetical protein